MYFYQMSLFLGMGFCFRLQNRNPTVKAVVQQRNAIVEFLVLIWVGEKQDKLRFFFVGLVVVAVFSFDNFWMLYVCFVKDNLSDSAGVFHITAILEGFIHTQKLVPMILIRSGPHAICCPEKQMEVNASFSFENGWMGSCRFYLFLQGPQIWRRSRRFTFVHFRWWVGCFRKASW